MTFFSGTDQATLKEEGLDRNHFVSLIVNNAGEYTAAITRRVSYTETRNITYPSFNGEERHSVEEFSTVEELEWFDLQIEFEDKEDVHLVEIGNRLSEIKEKKKTKRSTKSMIPSNNFPKSSVIKEPTLFDNEPIPSWYTGPKFSEENKKNPKESSGDKKSSIDLSVVSKKVNDTLINTIFYQLLTGSVLAGSKTIRDLNSWLGNMESVFDSRFGKDDPKLLAFNYWATGFVEFLTWYSAEDVESDEDTTAQYIAAKLVDKFLELPKTNKYTDEYLNILLSYGY